MLPQSGCIISPNSSGRGGGGKGGRGVVSAAQRRALDEIFGRAARFRQRQRKLAHGKSSSDDLMRECGGVYFEKPVEGMVLTASEAALPPPGVGGTVDVEAALPEALQEELRRDGLRLYGPVEATPRPAHMVAPGEYPALVQRLVAAGLVELKSAPALTEVGLFGRFKKPGSTRVLVDGRRGNAALRPPPTCGLPSVSALTTLAVPPGQRLHAAVYDLANFFHALRAPPALQGVYGLPPVTVAGKLLHPHYCTVPMGSSWAMVFAQQGHEEHLRQHSALYRASLRIGAEAVPRCLGVGELAAQPYVDDTPVLGCSAAACNAGMKELAAADLCPSAPQKDQLAGEGGVDIWGVHLTAEGLWTEQAPRARRLLADSKLLARRVGRRVGRGALRHVVGRWCAEAMRFRPLLSLLTPLYWLIGDLPSGSVVLTKAAAECLRTLRGLLPLLQVDPSLPTGSVIASDASDRAGAVVVMEPVDAAVFWRLARLTYYKGRDDLQEAAYQDELGVLIRTVLKPKAAYSWRWTREEDITVREARACYSSIQRATVRGGTGASPGQTAAATAGAGARAGARARAGVGAGGGRRHLALVDNQGVVGAFTKGRSRQPVLNSLIQRLASLYLATGHYVHLVWTPTHLQPADDASRV